MSANEHYHRCKKCRTRMEAPCTDRACGEGTRWVVLCMDCWLHLQDQSA